MSDSDEDREVAIRAGRRRPPRRDDFNNTSDLIGNNSSADTSGRIRRTRDASPSGARDTPAALSTPVRIDASASGESPSVLGSQSKDRRGILERMKERRNDRSSADRAEGSPTDAAAEEYAQSLERRKELLRRHKEQNKSKGAAGESAEEGSGRDTSPSPTANRGASGNRRSPLSGRRFRDGPGVKEEYDEEQGGGKKGETKRDRPKAKDFENDLDETSETTQQLVTIRAPAHIFPLKLLPTLRNSESAEQPLLSIPEPSLNPTRSLSDMFYNLTSCYSNSTMESVDELDLITGEQDDKYTIFNNNRQAIAAPSNASAVSKTAIDLIQANGAHHDGTLNTADSHATNLDLELTHLSDQTEGLFVGRMALVASQLMAGEEVGARIADMVSKNVRLARISQRILRDVHASVGMKKARSTWAEMSHSDISKASEVDRGLPSMMRAINFAPSSSVTNNTSISSGSAVIMKTFEDIVDEGLYEPVLPTPDSGVAEDEEANIARNTLGDIRERQFSALANRSEVLGHVPSVSVSGSDGKKHKKRNTLLVHLQTVNITHHPLMSQEDTLYVQLKRIYSTYRVLFEQQTTGYLVYRLHSLLAELSRVADGVPDFNELSTNDVKAIRNLLFDILETLPTLFKLRESIADLTGKLYDTWLQIKALRSRQGFVSTRALLTGRPISMSSRSDASNDDNIFAHVDAEVAQWNLMKGVMQTAPKMAATVVRKVMAYEATSKVKILSTTGATDGAEQGEGNSSPAAVNAQENKAAKPKAAARVTNSRGGSNNIYRELEDLPENMVEAISVLDQCVNYLLEAEFLPPVVYRLTALGKITEDPMSFSSSSVNNGPSSPARGGSSDAAAASAQPSTAQMLASLSAGERLLREQEKARRAAIAQLSVKVVLKVNGRVVTTTDPVPLQWPSFNADVFRTFELRVFHQPVRVTADIYICNNGMPAFLRPLIGRGDQLMASNVIVPVPQLKTLVRNKGESKDFGAQNLAPVADWCSFSSPLPAVTQDGNQSANAPATAIEGLLLCGSEYEVQVESAKVNRSTGIKLNQIAQLHARSGSLAQSAQLSRSSDASSDQALMSSAQHRDLVSEKFTSGEFQSMLPDLAALDLNDPQNEGILRLKKAYLLQDKQRQKSQRDPSALSVADTLSVTDENYHSNFLKYRAPDRIVLLSMRHTRPYLFSDPIPMSEAVIQKSELYKSLVNSQIQRDKGLGSQVGAPSYGSRSAAEGDEEEEQYGEGIGLPIARINGFLQRVRDSHTSLSRSLRQKKMSTNSVISEPSFFDVESPSDVDFSELLEPVRALKPKPKERKPPSSIATGCDLLVQIVGAKNVPLRETFEELKDPAKPASPVKGRSRTRQFEADSDEETDSHSATGSSVASVPLDKKKLLERRRARTFVEVRFQDQFVCTVPMDGGAPMWKQSLSLKVRAPLNDFSPRSLENLHDKIYFTLFDECLEDDSARGGHLEDEETKRIEKRYLGSFSLPFSTLFLEGKIDGVFRLDTPLFNFGYHSGSDRKLTEAIEMENASSKLGSLNFTRGVTLWDTIFGPPTRPVENVDMSHTMWNSNVDSATEAEFDGFASSSSGTYMKVMITLDPLLTPVIVPGGGLTANHMINADKFMATHAQRFVSDLVKVDALKHRDFTLFGTNSEGYKVLICRYLTPLQPPEHIISRRAAIHLVSMIPFMPDSEAFVGEFDLWCTNKQLWEMGAGDEEEHGVALYNFLLYLTKLKQGKKAIAEAVPASGAPTQEQQGDTNAPLSNSPSDGNQIFSCSKYPSVQEIMDESLFLVCGRGVPEGDTCYVLMKSSHANETEGAKYRPSNYVVVNPCNGTVHSAADKNCPLIEIACLVTPYNIWANIQADGRPHALNYDVLNRACWRPFFGQQLPFPTQGLASIQEIVTFTPTPQLLCVQIEKEVRSAIKSNFRKWRSKRVRSVTTFHPDACGIVTDHLHLLEEWKTTGDISVIPSGPPPASSRSGSGGNSVLRDFERLSTVRFSSDGVPEHIMSVLKNEVKSKLKNALRKRMLFGYPMNMTFTDVKSIIEKVKSLCIHETRHPNVQFVVAVKAFPHVNNVVSLWLFLGTLEEQP